MATPYEILRHEVDLHLFRIADNGDETQILDRPIEAQAAVFQFEEGEQRTVLSKGIGRYNQTIYAEQDPGQASLQITVAEFPDDMKAILFAGELAITDEVGAAVVDEAVIAPAIGGIVKLAHGNLTAAAVTVTGFTVTDDYIVDRAFGVLRIPEGSTIEAGEDLEVSYTYAATKVLNISGGIKPQQRFRAVMYLRNRPTSRYGYLEVFDVALARSGDTDILAAEPLTLEMSGVMTVPAGKTAPYEYIERRAAA